mgnify:CR=1 FL=1
MLDHPGHLTSFFLFLLTGDGGSEIAFVKSKKAEDAHKKDIQELESELRNIERKKEEFDETMKEESHSQTDSTAVILADDQIDMYQKLKEKAGKESARYMSELDTINREHRGDQDKLDNENRKKLDGESKVKNAVHCTDLPEDGPLEVEYFFGILQQ